MSPKQVMAKGVKNARVFFVKPARPARGVVFVKLPVVNTSEMLLFSLLLLLLLFEKAKMHTFGVTQLTTKKDMMTGGKSRNRFWT